MRNAQHTLAGWQRQRVGRSIDIMVSEERTPPSPSGHRPCDNELNVRVNAERLDRRRRQICSGAASMALSVWGRASADTEILEMRPLETL